MENLFPRNKIYRTLGLNEELIKKHPSIQVHSSSLYPYSSLNYVFIDVEQTQRYSKIIQSDLYALQIEVHYLLKQYNELTKTVLLSANQ